MSQGVLLGRIWHNTAGSVIVCHWTDCSTMLQGVSMGVIEQSVAQCLVCHYVCHWVSLSRVRRNAWCVIMCVIEQSAAQCLVCHYLCNWVWLSRVRHDTAGSVIVCVIMFHWAKCITMLGVARHVSVHFIPQSAITEVPSPYNTVSKRLAINMLLEDWNNFIRPGLHLNWQLLHLEKYLFSSYYDIFMLLSPIFIIIYYKLSFRVLRTIVISEQRCYLFLLRFSP